MNVTRIEPGRFCNSCGVEYRVEITVPPALWDRIRLDAKDCRLCFPCIADRIEALAAERLVPSRLVLLVPTGCVSAAEFLELALDAYRRDEALRTIKG